MPGAVVEMETATLKTSLPSGSLQPNSGSHVISSHGTGQSHVPGAVGAHGDWTGLQGRLPETGLEVSQVKER